LAYISGLGLTMAVMHFFKAAQPALLYLSPACILSVLITATVRGELKDLFAYTTEEDKKEEEEKKTKKEHATEEIEVPAEKEKGSISIEEIELEAEEDEEKEDEIVEELEDGEISKTTSRKKSNNNSKKRKNKK
jgi:minor histocompatibility antigen H13